MDPYRFPNEGAAPDPSTVFGATAGWLAFIALGMAAALGNPAGTGTPAVGLLTAAGAAVAAVAFFLLALRLGRRDQRLAPVVVRARIQPLPISPKQLDKVA